MEICPKRSADLRDDSAKCMADIEVSGPTYSICHHADHTEDHHKLAVADLMEPVVMQALPSGSQPPLAALFPLTPQESGDEGPDFEPVDISTEVSQEELSYLVQEAEWAERRALAAIAERRARQASGLAGARPDPESALAAPIAPLQLATLDRPPPTRCGCMNEGRGQCRLQSIVGSEPPRCHDCYRTRPGLCHCDCSGCGAPGERATIMKKEVDVSTAMRSPYRTRELCRCSCRCVPNHQCVIATLSYDASYDWRCGSCIPFAWRPCCECLCVGCIKTDEPSPLGTNLHKLILIRPYQLHPKRPWSAALSAASRSCCWMTGAVEFSWLMGALGDEELSRAIMEGHRPLRTFLFRGKPIEQGAIYATARPGGEQAVWLMVSSLRKFWPTWPTPYAHAMKDALRARREGVLAVGFTFGEEDAQGAS